MFDKVYSFWKENKLGIRPLFEEVRELHLNDLGDVNDLFQVDQNKNQTRAY